MFFLKTMESLLAAATPLNIGGAIVAGTVVAWAVSQKQNSVTVIEEESQTPQVCAKESYEQSSITEQELAKLYANPKFAQWKKERDLKLEEQAAEAELKTMWWNVALLLLVIVSVILLPFRSFDLTASNAVSLNDMIRANESVVAKLISCSGLMVMTGSFFFPAERGSCNLATVAGLIVMLVAADAVVFGPGFLALVAAVSLRVFWL